MTLFEEIMNYDSELQEAQPYSRTTSALDSAKSKVKGMFGGGQTEQGAQEVGNEANKYWNEFKRFIGRKYGKAQSSVPYQDVEQFFKGNGLDTKYLGGNARRSFTPKDVGSALLQAVRDQMNDYRDQDTTPRNKPKEEPPVQQDQAPAQGSTEEAPKGGNSEGLNTEIQSLSPAERSQLLTLLV